MLSILAVMYTLPLPIWSLLPLGILMGIFHGLAGFNIMHDACHGAFSSKPGVNQWVGNVMSLMGSHAYIWRTKHNFLHHTYTNIDGVDDDIAKWPLFRMSPTQGKKPWHKFQHIYMFLLYSISSIWWVFGNDVVKYITRKVNGHPLPRFPWQEHVIFWLTKSFYATVYVVLPIYFFGVGGGLLFFFSLHVTLGLLLSIVFQLAHVVENTHFEHGPTLLENAEKVPNEWAVHQIMTTSDFATRNWFATWFTGGLNFQVEHHLFPNISHIHYPKVHRIVKNVCKKYGIDFNEYTTFTEAVASHIRLMRDLGRVA